MKVIATVTGPLKKYVGKLSKGDREIYTETIHLGKEVLVSQITGVRDYPIEPQVIQYIRLNKYSKTYTFG